MAKAQIEEQASAPVPGPNNGEAEKSGTRMVTVLYSVHHDVYKVPSLGVDHWLSVRVYALETFGVSEFAVRTADRKGWRRLYNNWSIIMPGETVTLPADDPMVVDYAAATGAKKRAS
jgi:hypothetical protein